MRIINEGHTNEVNIGWDGNQFPDLLCKDQSDHLKLCHLWYKCTISSNGT